MKSYVIYIIECKNGAFYTGYTTDIERRYSEHVSGSTKCKYTRANPPKKLAAYWNLNATLSDILRIEIAIKKLSKPNKCFLVNNKNKINQIIKELTIENISYIEGSL